MCCSNSFSIKTTGQKSKLLQISRKSQVYCPRNYWTIYLPLENLKRTDWGFLEVITTLYNNRSILICQNSVYISKEWWYLSNQEQFRIKWLNWKSAKVLSRYFQSIGKQICKYTDDTSRLQKTTEYCRKVREY